MKSAITEYKKASSGYLPEMRLLDDIIEFIYWVIEKEPDKCQLYYCLGLINFLSKNDYSRALQEFELFLEITPTDLFPDLIPSAEGYLNAIRQKLIASDVEVGIPPFVKEIIEWAMQNGRKI